jgi:hypothetical protein
MQRSRRNIVAIGLIAGVGISLGTVQSACAVNVGGCSGGHDQQLATRYEAALQVDLRPYLDVTNPRAFPAEGIADPRNYLAGLIAASADKNGDGMVCWSLKNPVNAGTDKQWGVENYQLVSVKDNTSVGRL